MKATVEKHNAPHRGLLSALLLISLFKSDGNYNTGLNQSGAHPARKWTQVCFSWTHRCFICCNTDDDDDVCVCVGEACWWTIHPASKQRSEGEKVRVGDDLILVSVSSERYLVSSSCVWEHASKDLDVACFLSSCGETCPSTSRIYKLYLQQAK